MMSPIKYISFFDTQDSEIRRNYVTSASNKLEYIAKTIADTGHSVEIISMSEVIEDQFQVYKGETKTLSNKISIKLPFSWGGNKGLLRKLKILWHLVYMFIYLISHCRKNEPVIVYHSLGYFEIIRWAKRIRGFKLILEVEEIYSDVSKMSPYWRNLEFKMFELSDAFILSTELLNTKINKNKKPFVVIYGTYQVEPQYVRRFNDGKIHAVYAGTFDPNKGGAQSAISAAEFLSDKYHIHICGFGNECDVMSIKRSIEEINTKSKAVVTYDGMKKGKEFVEFLQKCHIGLSTQIPEGEYNDTSFPSKVLTYMSNGLSVVSIKIPVLLNSAVGEHLSFYSIPNGQEIATAIINADLTNDNRRVCDALNISFHNNIQSLLK